MRDLCECGGCTPDYAGAAWCPGRAVSGEISVTPEVSARNRHHCGGITSPAGQPVSTVRDSAVTPPAAKADSKSHEPSSVSVGLRELRDAKPVVGARGGILLDFTMYDERFDDGGPL